MWRTRPVPRSKSVKATHEELVVGRSVYAELSQSRRVSLIEWALSAKASDNRRGCLILIRTNRANRGFGRHPVLALVAIWTRPEKDVELEIKSPYQLSGLRTIVLVRGCASDRVTTRHATILAAQSLGHDKQQQ